MRVRVGAVLAAVLSAAAVAAAADVDPAKLVGSWKTERDKAAATLTFAKDGKVSVAAKTPDAELKFDGTYAVKGDQLTLKMTVAGKPRESTLTVKRLTDDELVTENAEKTRTETLKRVK